MTAAHPSQTGRAPALDRARGIAVVAMIVYHFAWDLSHFGLIETNVAVAAGWKLFAQAIAASFLFISGASLALGAASGASRRAFLRRLAIIAGAAALVTAATFLAFPQSYIFFGILHCIAISSVLALAFRGAPAAATALAGAATIVLPLFWRSPVFDVPWLHWLGLGEQAPVANDYVPVFPWSGFVLLGLAAGQAAGARLPRSAERSGDVVSRLGRWSLPVYLIHQPVLFGALALGVSLGVLPDRQAEATVTRACAVECQVSGAVPSVCVRACHCATQAMRKLPLWRGVLDDTLSFEDRQKADAIARACYVDASKTSPDSPKP